MEEGSEGGTSHADGSTARKLHRPSETKQFTCGAGGKTGILKPASEMIESAVDETKQNGLTSPNLLLDCARCRSDTFTAALNSTSRADLLVVETPFSESSSLQEFVQSALSTAPPTHVLVYPEADGALTRAHVANVGRGPPTPAGADNNSSRADEKASTSRVLRTISVRLGGEGSDIPSVVQLNGGRAGRETELLAHVARAKILGGTEESKTFIHDLVLLDLPTMQPLRNPCSFAKRIIRVFPHDKQNQSSLQLQRGNERSPGVNTNSQTRYHVFVLFDDGELALVSLLSCRAHWRLPASMGRGAVADFLPLHRGGAASGAAPARLALMLRSGLEESRNGVGIFDWGAKRLSEVSCFSAEPEASPKLSFAPAKAESACKNSESESAEKPQFDPLPPGSPRTHNDLARLIGDNMLVAEREGKESEDESKTCCTGWLSVRSKTSEPAHHFCVQRDAQDEMDLDSASKQRATAELIAKRRSARNALENVENDLFSSALDWLESAGSKYAFLICIFGFTLWVNKKKIANARFGGEDSQARLRESTEDKIWSQLRKKNANIDTMLRQRNAYSS